MATDLPGRENRKKFHSNKVKIRGQVIVIKIVNILECYKVHPFIIEE